MLKRKSKKSLNGKDKLTAIAEEITGKMGDYPYVAGVVARPYGTYLHFFLLLEPDTDEKSQRDEVFHTYSEVCRKYDDEDIEFELTPMTCFSPDIFDEIASDNPGSIIYRRNM